MQIRSSLVQSSSGHVTRHECCAAETINAGFVVFLPHRRRTLAHLHSPPGTAILKEKATVKGAEQVTHLAASCVCGNRGDSDAARFRHLVQDEAV